MRHIWSLIAGVIITPLAWFLIAVGQGAMSKGLSLLNNDNFLLGGLMVIGVGLTLGLIGSLRTSPVGALIAAVTYLSTSVYMLLAPLQAFDLLGKRQQLGDYGWDLASPVYSGTMAVVGGMLLIAAFSAARWRGDAGSADPNAWMPPEPAPAWTPPTVSTPTSEPGSDRSS